MSNLAIILASILSSGVVAAVISSGLAEAKERWILRRTKIEEIYLSTSSWITYIHRDFLLYLRVCKGKLTYDQLLDMVIERNKNEKKDLGDLHLRMKMNINMYEPSLIPYLQRLEVELAKSNKLRFRIEDCWKRTGQASEMFEPFNKQLEVLFAASDSLTVAIVQRGVAIGSESGLLSQSWTQLRSNFRRLFSNVVVFARRVKRRPRATLP